MLFENSVHSLFYQTVFLCSENRRYTTVYGGFLISIPVFLLNKSRHKIGAFM